MEKKKIKKFHQLDHLISSDLWPNIIPTAPIGIPISAISLIGSQDAIPIGFQVIKLSVNVIIGKTISIHPI